MKAEQESREDGIKETEILNHLANFNGTENYFKIPFSSWVYTDGIQSLIQKCKCHWLISDMGIELDLNPRLKAKIKDINFLILRIEVSEDNTALLTLREDSNEPTIWKKKLDYTNFPLRDYEFYLIDKVMLLKGEY